jgi:hypothetical protein
MLEVLPYQSFFADALIAIFSATRRMAAGERTHASYSMMDLVLLKVLLKETEAFHSSNVLSIQSLEYIGKPA